LDRQIISYVYFRLSCEFAKAKCDHKDLLPEDDFTVCKNNMATVGRRGQRSVVTSDVFMAPWCEGKDQVTCSDELHLLCGTDGRFYRNAWVLLIFNVGFELKVEYL